MDHVDREFAVRKLAVLFLELKSEMEGEWVEQAQDAIEGLESVADGRTFSWEGKMLVFVRAHKLLKRILPETAPANHQNINRANALYALSCLIEETGKGDL